MDVQQGAQGRGTEQGDAEPAARAEILKEFPLEERKQLFERLNCLAERLWHLPGYAEDLREVRRLMYLVGYVGALREEDLSWLYGLLALHKIK